MNRMITVEVLHEYAYTKWTLPEFQHVLAEAVEQIPPEFRAEATVALDGGGGEETAKLEIYYVRPEADAEVAERASRYAHWDRENEEEERREYERLKAKYGA